jgi:hypothetical protein
VRGGADGNVSVVDRGCKMKIESLDIVLYTALFLLPGFFMRNIVASISPAKKTSNLTYNYAPN